ncbi:MAG: thiamine monophosphate synthase [Chitinophagaceae bacterium]|nr:thiamine monophosphate synthase [Chitinophagaceae bacterium]
MLLFTLHSSLLTNMKLTVCSVHKAIPDEQELVRELFDVGLTHFHLRKPSHSKEEMRDWLEQLNDSERQKVVIHSHWSLSEEFSLKGLHFGATVIQQMSGEECKQWMHVAKEKQLTISSSVHHQEEIDRLPIGFDYVWLSPVFESISKQEYTSIYSAAQFDHWVKELQEQKRTTVYALGGIQAQHMQELSRRGFDGAAVLGSVWSAINGLQDRALIKERIKQLTVACKTDPTS